MIVTAVLERTALVHSAATNGEPEDRVLARRTHLLVKPTALRWGEPVARPGLVPLFHERERRCSDCRRTAAETEFRAYKAAHCVECSRRRQAVINEARRLKVA